MDISIASNSRTCIVGMTGCGKTYLATELLKDVDRLVVFDTKENLRDRMNLEPGMEKHRKNHALWRDFRRGEGVRIQITPPITPLSEFPDYFDKICREILATGDCIVYIDETGDVTQSAVTVPSYLAALYRKGREPIYDRKGRLTGGNIGMVASTQRPSGIPIFFMSESTHYFNFRLQNPDDRLRMVGYIGDAARTPIKDPHGFYYYNYEMEAPVYVAEL